MTNTDGAMGATDNMSMTNAADANVAAPAANATAGNASNAM